MVTWDQLKKQFRNVLSSAAAYFCSISAGANCLHCYYTNLHCLDAVQQGGDISTVFFMALQPDLATTNCNGSTIRLNQHADFSSSFVFLQKLHTRKFKHIATKGNLQQHAKNPTHTYAAQALLEGIDASDDRGGEFWPVWCMTHSQRVTKQRGIGGGIIWNGRWEEKPTPFLFGR